MAKNYETADHRALTTVFTEPAHLATKETIVGAADRMTALSLIVNRPDTGSVEDADFSWTGSYGLAAAAVGVDRSFEDKRARHEFFSGVALATAAAALIGAFQEGNDRIGVGHRVAVWMRLRRTKRRIERSKADSGADNRA